MTQLENHYLYIQLTLLTVEIIENLCKFTVKLLKIVN